MFGLIGAVCALTGWPFMLLLDYVGLEAFEWPSAGLTASLVANGLLGSVLPDMLFARAVMLGNPTLCTIGLSFTIPMAMVFDALSQGSSEMFNIQWLVGALLIWLSFFNMNDDGASDECRYSM